MAPVLKTGAPLKGAVGSNPTLPATPPTACTHPQAPGSQAFSLHWTSSEPVYSIIDTFPPLSR